MGTTPIHNIHFDDPETLFSPHETSENEANSVEAALTALSGTYQRLITAGGQAVATGQSTTSTSFTDLATVGPQATVEVGPSGRILVFAKCEMSSPSDVAIYDFALSGANTVAPNLDRAIRCGLSTGVGLTLVASVPGLTPGSTTVTLKYRSAAGGAVSFLRRFISVYVL